MKGWKVVGVIFDSFVALLRKNCSNIVLYPENRLFNLGITIYWMIGGRAVWGDTATLCHNSHLSLLTTLIFQATAGSISWAGSMSMAGLCLTPPDRRLWSWPTKAPGPATSPGYSRSPMDASQRYSEGGKNLFFNLIKNITLPLDITRLAQSSPAPSEAPSPG